MLKYHNVWLTVAVLLIMLVVYLSLAPNPPNPLTFENSDKLEHGLAYAMLSFWFCQIYRSAGSRAAVIAGLIGMGVALEYVQGWSGYRSYDVQDMQANSIGVLAGWLLACTALGRLLAHIENRLVR
jgi:VanZ family protein